MTLLSFLFNWFIGIYTTWKRLVGEKKSDLHVNCCKIKETFRSGIIKMAISDIMWEMGSHRRSTEITAASCWAPGGLDWIPVGAGASQPPVWISAGIVPLSPSCPRSPAWKLQTIPFPPCLKGCAFHMTAGPQLCRNILTFVSQFWLSFAWFP